MAQCLTATACNHKPHRVCNCDHPRPQSFALCQAAHTRAYLLPRGPPVLVNRPVEANTVLDAGTLDLPGVPILKPNVWHLCLKALWCQTLHKKHLIIAQAGCSPRSSRVPESQIVSGKSWRNSQHLQPSMQMLMLYNKASTVVKLATA